MNDEKIIKAMHESGEMYLETILVLSQEKPIWASASLL